MFPLWHTSHGSARWHGLKAAVMVGGLACFACLASGRADLIAEDDFSKYIVGSPPGSVGGKGWKTRWSVGPDATAIVETAPGPDGAVQNCLRVSGKNTMRALMRRIANPEAAAEGPIYLRVVFDIVENSSPSADMFSSWTFSSDPASLTASVSTGLKNPPTARIGESRKALPEKLTAGRIYTLVAKLGGWNPETKHYTEITLWIDPEPDADEASQAGEVRLFGDSGGGLFEVLVFRIHDLAGGAYRLFDVRLATSWDEVVAVR
jgi:hypothetical protein